MPDNRDAFKLESAGTLTAATGKDRWVAPFNGEIIGTNGVVGTAPTGAALIFDLMKAPAATPTTFTSIYATNTKPTIAISGTTAALAAPDTGSTKFSTGDVFRLDITQIGSTVAGADLDVVVEFVA